MDILDVYTAVGGCKENEQIPALLIQALQPHRFSIESEVHKFLERVTKDIKVIQSIHHQQYHETYWSNKVQLLESFSKSINEGQIFDHIAVANNEISEFEDCLRDMQIPELSKLVECVDWLQGVDEDCVETSQHDRMKQWITEWILNSPPTTRAWFVKQATGAPILGGVRLNI